MKAISRVESLARAIADGGRSMLAMTWPTPYRGELLIVAVPHIRDMYREPHVGTAVCVIDLKDSRPMRESDAKTAGVAFDRHLFAWVLENPHPVPEVKITGAQFLYDVAHEFFGHRAEPVEAVPADGRRSWKQAMEDAEAFRDLFPRATYEQWEFAGSVRRRMPSVKDIEHVIIPAYGEIEIGGGLFAQRERVNLLWHHLDAMLKTPLVGKHLYANSKTGAVSPRWGDTYRGVDFRGFNHELFTAAADNWGSIFAIRTGPGEFSQMLVTVIQQRGYMNSGGQVLDKSQTMCACGWSGSEPRWVSTSDPTHQTKAKRILRAPGRDEESFAVCPSCGRDDSLRMPVVPVPTEEEYFKLCGVPWTPPENRFAPVRMVG